jgi:hypothetical protein
MRRFNVAVPEGTRDALDQALRAHRDAERAWLEDRRERAAFLMGRQRREALRQIRIDLAAERDAGRLLGTRGALLTHHLRAVLTERRLDRRWPPIPPGTIRSGRPTGRSHSAHSYLWPERVNVDLPDDLAEQMQRAAHHTSAKAAAELEAFADRWGKGPLLATNTLELLTAALGGTPSADDLQRRRDLRAKITTTGDLLRAAIHHATTT